MQKRKGSWGFFKREVILDENNQPYIKRWRLLETPWFSVFVHHILRSDTDRDLHTHPWKFTSFLLKGSYVEELNDPSNKIEHSAPCIIKRKPSDAHRITLKDGKPVWTLFFVGKKTNEWGFNTSAGWVHNKEYNDNKHLQKN